MRRTCAFQMKCMRGLAKARSWMIFWARSWSRRWMTWTIDGELGQEHALFDGRVAAADDRDRLVAVQGAVAGGAVRDAAPEELGLAGDAELARLDARREDDGPRRGCARRR